MHKRRGYSDALLDRVAARFSAKRHPNARFRSGSAKVIEEVARTNNGCYGLAVVIPLILLIAFVWSIIELIAHDIGAWRKKKRRRRKSKPKVKWIEETY